MLETQRNLYVLRRWWWLLLGALLIGGVAAFLITKLVVTQQYQGTALIALAPPPISSSGLFVTTLQASADSQLIPTESTARAALRLLPASRAAAVQPIKLAEATTSLASLDNEILTVQVRWPSVTLAPLLTNRVANAFVRQERARLAHRYQLIHRQLAAQEARLTALTRAAAGQGTAADWLRGQYAYAAAKVYQEDADARAQAAMQETGLSVAQPATEARAVGPKPAINAAIGAALALILALIYAYAVTDTYGEGPAAETPRRILARAGE